MFSGLGNHLMNAKVGLTGLAIFSTVFYLTFSTSNVAFLALGTQVVYMTCVFVAVMTSSKLVKRFWNTQGKFLFVAMFLGVSAWFLGEFLWEVYIFLFGVELPYPSIADAFWLTGYLILSYVLFELYKMSEVALTRGMRLFSALLALGLAGAVSYMLVGPTIAELSESPIAAFFDLAYPFYDVFAMFFSVSILFSLSMVKQNVNWLPIPLFFLVNTVADVLFSYFTLQGTYYVGHPIDVLWMLGYLCLAYGCYKVGAFDFLVSTRPPKI